MTGAQIAVAAYGSAWAAYSTWRAWPDQCRKIAQDIATGLVTACRMLRSETRPLCSCGDAWHRSEFKHARAHHDMAERHEQFRRQIRARLDEVHRINDAAEIMWHNATTSQPHPGGGGGSGKATITVGGTTGISHPDPRSYLVPGSERKTLEYEYRTVVDSRLTDDRGFYRTVTQRRLRDAPGAAWEDTGFGYCPPPRDDPGMHELCR